MTTPNNPQDQIILPQPYQRTLPDRFIPEQVVTDIIGALGNQSVVRALARNIPLTTRVGRITIPAEVARAYWVKADNGPPHDLGLKKLTRFGLKDLDFVVEELAALIVIPNAYVDDANVPLWDYARNELTAAFARKLDLAFLFGIDRPETSGDSVIEIAQAAGNVVPSTDLTQGMLQLLATVPGVNGIATESTFPYAVASQNTSALWFDPRGPAGVNLFGLTVQNALDGGWDDSQASALVGNWTHAILGIRQDLTFDMFDQGVITDESGNIVVNLMQQDAQALRSVMRVAWAVQPGRKLAPDGTFTEEAPFGALEPISLAFTGASGAGSGGNGGGNGGGASGEQAAAARRPARQQRSEQPQ